MKLVLKLVQRSSLLLLLFVSLLMIFSFAAMAQPEIPVFTDPAVDAPELAYRGAYGVGLRTLELVDEGQIDILRLGTDPNATYDRLLLTHVWYPAEIPDGTEALTLLTDDNIVAGFQFYSRALRDAAPDLSAGPYPLIVISHGLGGSNLQLSHLGDNLASKGYIVAAVDHADGAVGLASVQTATYYRPFDIRFVIDELAAMSDDPASFLAGMVQADNIGLIGYSYGGYGALLTVGAGIAEPLAANPLLAPGGAAAANVLGAYEADPRVKAVFTFAPFGNDLSALNLRGASYWLPEAYAVIEVPLFIMVGSDDDVAFYETGALPVFEGTVNTQRYLLTVLNARHNVAPNPSPPTDDLNAFFRHGEPAWRSDRLNNLGQHFVTAFMGLHLQGDDSFAAYLDLVPVASEGRDDTQWAGFPPRTALGMIFEARAPGE